MSLFLQTLVCSRHIVRWAGASPGGVSHEEDFDSLRNLRACGRSDGPLAQAQPAGIQAAFGKDARTLSDKFTGLARVMSGKVRLEARPGRSLRRRCFQPDRYGEPHARRRASGTPNTGAKPAPITDPEKLREALKASYVDLQKAITGLSDNDLQAPVKLFGRDMTKQGALMLILNDQHEHLGQSIAYARSTASFRPGPVGQQGKTR